MVFSLKRFLRGFSRVCFVGRFEGGVQGGV